MPCLAGNYSPAVGILVQVAILRQHEIAALQPSSKTTAPGAAPDLNLTMFAGLVDTGASTTCISKNVADAIGLAPSGKTTMSGSTGHDTVNQYTFVVGFVFGAKQVPSGAFLGDLNLHLVQGCEFTSHGFGFDVLIGRDILCKGSLSMSFDGHYLLCF